MRRIGAAQGFADSGLACYPRPAPGVRGLRRGRLKTLAQGGKGGGKAVDAGRTRGVEHASHDGLVDSEAAGAWQARSVHRRPSIPRSTVTRRSARSVSGVGVGMHTRSGSWRSSSAPRASRPGPTWMRWRKTSMPSMSRSSRFAIRTPRWS